MPKLLINLKIEYLIAIYLIHQAKEARKNLLSPL